MQCRSWSNSTTTIMSQHISCAFIWQPVKWKLFLFLSVSLPVDRSSILPYQYGSFTIFVAKHSNGLWRCLNSYRNALAMGCVVVHIFVPTFQCTLHMLHFHYKVVLCSQQTSVRNAFAMQTCWQKTYREMVHSHSNVWWCLHLSSTVGARRWIHLYILRALLQRPKPFALHVEVFTKDWCNACRLLHSMEPTRNS